MYKLPMMDLDGKKHPGQNYKNKLDCWISSHRSIKKCRKLLDKQAAVRLAKIEALAEKRTAMHTKGNAARAERKARLLKAQ